MQYKRAKAGKEVGATPGPMDHELALDETDARPADPAAEAADRRALTWPGLALVSTTIVVGAIALCCLLAVAVMLAVAATQGRQGLADLASQYRFDLGLRARVGAATLSAFYLGVAGATLLAARLVDPPRWRTLVALCPIKAGRGRTLALSLATLAYAAVTTYAIQTAQNQHLIDEGPTDVLLLGTLLLNLCILAPLAEELFFRGWLYSALRRRLAFWPTYVPVTVLFAAIHWYASLAHILKVLPLALVLGLVREWKGSIKATIALHAVYNLTIVLITLIET